MTKRWKTDRPLSRQEFEELFPDDEACAQYLAKKRWSEGFECPKCGCTDAWVNKDLTRECKSCGRQTSVTAGTFMHRTHLPLKTWFLAMHMVTSHSNGISAVQLQGQLGIGSYKTAWLLLQKIRRAMVDPERNLLAGFAEIDETSIAYRAAEEADSPSGVGRSKKGKILIAGAVELSGAGHPCRIRLSPIKDYSAETLLGFISRNVEPGAHVITDGWSGYSGIEEHIREERVIGEGPAHEIMKWIHRVFSNLKRWALGVYHGLRRKHIQRYLDEFVFRWNRRRHTREAFDDLINIGLKSSPATYRDFVEESA